MTTQDLSTYSFIHFLTIYICFDYCRWRGKTILDDVVEEVDASAKRVRNTLRLPALRRSDHGARLTCKAANTNLTAPAKTSVNINMVCKYRIQAPLNALCIVVVLKAITPY